MDLGSVVINLVSFEVAFTVPCSTSADALVPLPVVGKVCAQTVAIVFTGRSLYVLLPNCVLGVIFGALYAKRRDLAVFPVFRVFYAVLSKFGYEMPYFSKKAIVGHKLRLLRGSTRF